MSRFSFWLLAACVVAATAVLLALGTWQVQRLHWKEALIEEIGTRRTAEPLALGDMLDIWRDAGSVDYRPVTLSGRFEHDREVYFYSTHRGAVGWDVLTPLTLDDGRHVIVDRGFVPDTLRDPATRPAGQLEGTVTLTGLARDPQSQRPNAFVPDNRPDKREFYWKDFAAIAAAMQLDAGLVPFMVDAAPSDIPGGYPQGGTTLVAFPNNHLQYAITWYGLAAACLGVGGFFLFSRRRPPRRAGREGP